MSGAHHYLSSWAAWLVRSMILLLVAGAAWKTHEVRGRLARPSPGDAGTVEDLQRRLDSIPLTVGSFHGHDDPLGTREQARTGGDSHRRIRYTDEEGHEVTFYAAAAAQFNEYFHTPTVCLPSQGWELRDRELIPDAAGRSGRIERTIFEYGGSRMLIYSWLQVGAEVMEAKWGRRLVRFLDLLEGRPPRVTWLVIIYVPILKSEGEASSVAHEFMAAFVPFLQRVVEPGEGGAG